jgi:hypothetical protein
MVTVSAYDALSNHYEARAFGTGLGSGILSKYKAVDPMYIIEDRFCGECKMFVDVPNLYVQPASRELIAQGAFQHVALTDRAAAEVVDALAADGGLWLSAAEPASWHVRGDAFLASLSSDGTNVGLAVAVRDGVLNSVVGARMPDAGGGVIPASALGPSSAAAITPEPRAEFGAVLSGREGAVYVVGGVDANGSPLGNVWRFDISGAKWQVLPLSGAPPGMVLAATYRPNDRSLYVVDQFEDAGHWDHDEGDHDKGDHDKGGHGKRGRLLRIDLSSYAVTVVGHWKRQNKFDRIYLSNAPQGDLLLVGSSESKQKYRGLRFRYDGQNDLDVVDWFRGQGFVVQRPTLTQWGLTLPLLQGSEVVNAFRPTDALHDQPHHSFEECM